MNSTRRSVLKSAALGAAFGAVRPLLLHADAQAGSAGQQPLPPGPGTKDDSRQWHGLKVGVCSYSLRTFSADEMLADAQRLGVHSISVKEVHLPLTSTPEERRQFRDKAEQRGLTIHSCGVIYLKNDEAAMGQALNYVKDLGAPIAVVGVSRDQLPMLDKVIKGYELKAAIHNHGPNDKRFPSPLEVYDAIQPLDNKIGVCMDIGHTFRMHEDLVADVRKTFDRLYSMHFKDLESGDIRAKGVPVGTGVLPIVPLLRELVRSGYTGEVQLEYEVEPKDPLPGMAESLGFMRGTLQAIT
jgi:inosose dehydratase